MCVQEREFVPVTITFQALSALGTIIQLTSEIHTSELDMPTGDAEMFLVSLRSDPAGIVLHEQLMVNSKVYMYLPNLQGLV